MAASALGKDMEALVDLFLSPNFRPFEPESEPIARTLAHTGVVYEAEVADGIEDDVEEEAVKDLTKQCGKILAKFGDEFYQSYALRTPTVSADPPWFNISEKIRSILLRAAQFKDTDPDFEQKKIKAWNEFKEIMSNSISDTPVIDVYRQLGAVLLTLKGLSNMAVGAKGLARVFIIRYIRDRQLDTQIQNLGGLNHLIEQELD